MLNARENENITNEISGLALAVLFDRCFVDLFDICESNKRPLKRYRARRSLRAIKHAKRFAGKDIFLRRF